MDYERGLAEFLQTLNASREQQSRPKNVPQGFQDPPGILSHLSDGAERSHRLQETSRVMHPPLTNVYQGPEAPRRVKTSVAGGSIPDHQLLDRPRVLHQPHPRHPSNFNQGPQGYNLFSATESSGYHFPTRPLGPQYQPLSAEVGGLFEARRLSREPQAGNHAAGRPRALDKRKRHSREPQDDTATEESESKQISKLADKKAKLAEEVGGARVGNSGKSKGKIRQGRGQFWEWYDEDQKTWRPAAPHDWFRSEFIGMDAPQDLNGGYDEEPECGEGDDNITSFGHAQMHWKSDPDTWSNIVDRNGNQVMLLDEPPQRTIPTPEVGYLIHEDLIMLDPDDNPIVDWPDIPLTFASKMKGWRMEALRRVYPWLREVDFRARMPREDVVGLSGIGRRMEQARKEYLLIPWNKRKNSDKVTRDTMLKRQEQAGTQPPSPAESDHASSATHSHVKSKNSEVGLKSLVAHSTDAQTPVRAHDVWVQENRERESSVNASANSRHQRQPTLIGCKRALDTTGHDRDDDLGPVPKRRYEPWHQQYQSPKSPLKAQNGRIAYMPAYSTQPAYKDHKRSVDTAAFDEYGEAGPVSKRRRVEQYAQSQQGSRIDRPNRASPQLGSHYQSNSDGRQNGALELPYVSHSGVSRLIASNGHLEIEGPHDFTHPPLQTSDIPATRVPSNVVPADDWAKIPSSVHGSLQHPQRQQTRRGLEGPHRYPEAQDGEEAETVDFRTVPPRNEQDITSIQNALLLTQANYFFHTGRFCRLASMDQPYMSHANRIFSEFGKYWVNSGKVLWLPMPLLCYSDRPWRGSHQNWELARGSEAAILEERAAEYRRSIGLEEPNEMGPVY